jgi:hypothetical protein
MPEPSPNEAMYAHHREILRAAFELYQYVTPQGAHAWVNLSVTLDRMEQTLRSRRTRAEYERARRISAAAGIYPSSQAPQKAV